MNKLQRTLNKHQAKFRPTAWQNYSPEELSNWVSLLSKRSTHRTDRRSAMKDIKDAENYLMFLKEKIKTTI